MKKQLQNGDQLPQRIIELKSDKSVNIIEKFVLQRFS